MGSLTTKAGTAVSFDGSTNFISIGSQDFGLTNGLTVMAWVQWEINPESGNDWANIFTINSVTTKDYGQFWIQHNQTNTKFEFALQTTIGRKYIQSNTKPVAGQWYHVAGVYNGSTMSLYINGNLEAQANHSGNIKAYEPSFQTMIGQWAYNSEVYRRFAGSLDDVTIYNKALSNVELIERMEDADMITFPDAGLVGAWKFDEEDGEVVVDYSGFDYDGTIINDVTRIMGDAPNNADGSGNLPVEVVNMAAEIYGSKVIFSWQTLAENNNAKYVVTKSYDGKNYQLVEEVEGAGNSNVMRQYAVIDENPGTGVVYYRLAQIDFDGTKATFKPLAVQLGGAVEISVYPVPSSSNQAITIESATASFGIVIRNQAGQIIENQQVDGFSQDIFIEKPGVYFAEIRMGEQVKIQKLIVN